MKENQSTLLFVGSGDDFEGLRGTFHEAGYELAFAPGGKDAFLKLESDVYRACLISARDADMAFLQTAAWMRTQTGRKVPLIALMDLLDQELVNRVQAYGVHACLQWPEDNAGVAAVMERTEVVESCMSQHGPAA